MSDDQYIGLTTQDFAENNDNSGALSTITLMPTFNQIHDFSTLEHLQEEKYSSEHIRNQKKILEVNYHYEHNFPQLKLYGIHAWKNEEKQILELTYDKNSVTYISSKYTLRFSGDISLSNRVELISEFTILDSAVFIGKGSLYLNPNPHLYKKTTSGYIRNTDIAYLEINNVDNLWFSGSIRATKIEVTGTDLPLSRDNYCTINIGTQTILSLTNEFIINNPNCLNIAGSLFAQKVRFSSDKTGEIYIAPQAIFHGLEEMSFNSGESILYLQYGSIYTKKLSIHINEAFHNYGSINLEGNHFGKFHDVMVKQFINHKNAEVKINGNAKLLSSTSPINQGTIIQVNGQLTLGSPAGIASTAMINQGVIKCVDDSSLVINSFIGIANLDGEIIASQGSIDLSPNPDDINKSKFILLKDGVIAIGDANLNADKLLAVNSRLYFENGNTSLEKIYIQNTDLTTKNMKFTQEIDLYTYDQSIAILDGEGTINIVKMETRKQDLIALPSGAMPLSAIGSLPLAKIGNNLNVEGFVQISGRFNVTKGIIGGNQVLFVGGDQAAEIGFKSLVIQPQGILAVDDNGRVFIEDGWMENSAIMAKGSVEITKSWTLLENILLHGNIKTPTLTIDCNTKLVLSDTMLAVEGDVFNKAMLEVLGNSIIIAEHFVNMGEIYGSGSLSIESKTFVMKAITETLTRFVGNHQFIDTEVTNQPKIDITGILRIKTEEFANLEGVHVTADKIYIESESKIIIAPMAIYHRAHEYWGSGHKTKEVKDFVLTEFVGKNGISIVSKEGNFLYAPQFKSKVQIILETEGENIIEGVYKIESSESYDRHTKRTWYGSKKQIINQEHHLDTTAIMPSFGEDLLVTSGNGTSFLGVYIDGSDKSVMTIGKQGREVLAIMAPMMELHIHDFYSRKTITGWGIKWAASKHTHYSYIENPIMNLIKAPNGLFGYCHGIWKLSAIEVITKDNDNLIHFEATKEIHLLAASRIEITHNHHERFKVGLVATANPSEISIGFGGVYTKTDEAILAKTPIQGIYRGNMHLIAPLVHTQGVKALGKTFLVEAKKWHDEPAYAEYNYSFKLTQIEVAVKIGIRSPLGNFLNNVEGAGKGLSSGTPEGFINAGFAGYAAYLTGVQMLGGLIMPGAWVSMSVSKSTTDSKEIIAVPSIFNFTEFKADATEISLFASQINAYNAYIKAEELLLSSASDQSTIKQQQRSLDIEIPITGSGAPSLGLNVGKFKQYSEKHLHFVLNANDVEMHIAGKATMKGVTISANHLSASFGELMIESLKDVVKSEGFGLGIGLSADKVDKLKSLGGSYNKGLREIVSEISSIIAKKDLEIIVANALVLNGAMIANAERNADGNLTDHGNLKVVAGELFVKHIHQIIDEKSFGASVDLARKISTEKGKLGEKNNIYKVSLGAKQGDNYVLGTIGEGTLIMRDTHGETVNRDVNKANTAIELDVDIDQINTYFPGRDSEAESIAAKRLKNEGIGGIVLNNIKDAGKQFSKMFSTLKYESNVKQEENIINLDKKDETQQTQEDLAENSIEIPQKQREGKLDTKENSDNNNLEKRAYYNALKRKGIIINDNICIVEDNIDGEFLSKLNKNEFIIDNSRGSLLVFLDANVDNHQVYYKEYDIKYVEKLINNFNAKRSIEKSSYIKNIIGDISLSIATNSIEVSGHFFDQAPKLVKTIHNTKIKTITWSVTYATYLNSEIKKYGDKGSETRKIAAFQAVGNIFVSSIAFSAGTAACGVTGPGALACGFVSSATADIAHDNFQIGEKTLSEWEREVAIYDSTKPVKMHNVYVVSGISREHVAAKYNVHLDMVYEDDSDIDPNKQFTINGEINVP